MWKVAAFALVKAILFGLLAILVLFAPVSESVADAYSYSDLSPGLELYDAIAMSALLHGFLPSLVVDAALVGLFPSWRVLRAALPVVTALTLFAWASQMWLFFGPTGKFPEISVANLRWSLIVAGPLGIVAAGAFMFLLARARRLAAPLG